MRVLTVCNYKGGVGKTTTSKMLAEYFSGIGKQVLIVDLDPQCNISNRFLHMEMDTDSAQGYYPPLHPLFDDEETRADDPDWMGRSSSADIYTHGSAYIYETEHENISILPGHSADLDEVAKTPQNSSASVASALAEWLGNEALSESFDIAIIDTPPSKNTVAVSAIKAASHLLIVSQMEEMSIEGMSAMIQLWQRENWTRADSEECVLVGVLPTLIDSRYSVHNDNLQALKKNPSTKKHLLKSVISRRSAYNLTNTSNAQPVSVLNLAPSSAARQEAEACCKEIKRKVFK